jgi:hypothetical protein
LDHETLLSAQRALIRVSAPAGDAAPALSLRPTLLRGPFFRFAVAFYPGIPTGLSFAAARESASGQADVINAPINFRLGVEPTCARFQ